MNLTVEHVLMFALVFCAFYYLKDGCGCKEGIAPGKEKECAENWTNLQNMSVDQIKEYVDYLFMLKLAAAAKDPRKIKEARTYYDNNVLPRDKQIVFTLQDIYHDGCGSDEDEGAV